MKKMNKKGFFGLTLGMMVVAAIIITIVFAGTAWILWLLRLSIFYIIGGVMIILALVTFLTPGKIMPTRLAFTVLIIGAVLVVLPIGIDTLQGLSIASIIQ